MKQYFAAWLLGAIALGASASTTSGNSWHVKRRWPVAGSQGWDYLSLDAATSRLFVSRSDRVLALDARSGKPVGEIGGLSGVHGVALAEEVHRGFISNGRSNSVTVFDPTTLKVERTIAVNGEGPDSILHDPFSHRVFTFNGHSQDASVIDESTGKLLGKIALPGRPEFAVSDGQGHVYDNIEDKNELVELDPGTQKVTAVWPLRDCEGPSGLAIDTAHRRLFSVCQNETMAVVDADTGKPVANVPIGDGPDAAAFDARRRLVFSSNGRSGTLTVIHQDDANHYRVVSNVPTQKSARTMALDPDGDVYLAAARFGPRPAPSAANPGGRPPVLPGTFVILVVGR